MSPVRHPLFTLAAAPCLALLLSGAQPALSGREMMQRVNARDPGGHCRMGLRMELRDLRDPRRSYTREVEMLRKAVPGGHRTRYRVGEPERYRGISLLLLEDRQPVEMWMYFPASDHRAQVATRGISALGGDFSCEDLRTAFDLEAFEFRLLGRETRQGLSLFRVEMVPRTPQLARELGYSRAVGTIRADPWMVIEAEYYDASGKRLRSFRAAEIDRVDGVWIARRQSMENTRIGHRTDVRVESADCRTPVADAGVDPARLGKH